MSVKVLCVGDVVGRPGRFALSQLLPQLVSSHDISCVIANVENAAGGSGLTVKLHDKFRRYGVNLMTMGDHLYRKREIIQILEREKDVVRPINLPESAPGPTLAVHETMCGHKVAVFSVMGRLFMNMQSNSPFTAIDATLATIPQDINIVIADVHAEATSEKIAIGWYLDGKVSCVYGTHTHVQTADDKILPKGTAYITDLGMTGPHDSVLGRRKDRVIETLRTGIPSPFEVAKGQPTLCGIIVEIDPSGSAQRIERVCIEAPMPDDMEDDDYE